MTIEIKGTRNYAATVIRVPELRKAQNSDRLYIIDKLGMTAIVDESWLARVGELALLFPAEVQLSEAFVSANNLYRHSDLNADPTQAGYLEDNRRVRALKLRGNISNGLALPLSSLNVSLGSPGVPGLAIGFEEGYFSEGDVFDSIDGVEICRKYTIPVKQAQLTRAERKVKKAFRRVDEVFLPEHFETGQWLREEESIADDTELIITQKLHGTSVRLAHTIVKRKLTWLEKIAQKLGVAVKDHDYDLVAGSRRSIKDPNNPDQAHFYGEDIWTDALKIYGDQIPKNHIVYGELVGYITGTDSPIQKGHTYEAQEGDYHLYVYRVAVITEDADLIDLSWTQVRAFCERHGLRHVPELARNLKGSFNIDHFVERDFRATYDGAPIYRDEPVALSPGGTGADEGIAIRIEDGMSPGLWKFKNKSHYLYETAQLDSGEADLESLG